jgi:hypothetical protein
MNWNGPAKLRGRLGFPDFVYVLGFNKRGRDEEISMERGVGEIACEEMGTGRPGETKQPAEGVSLKEMRWRTAQRWRSPRQRPRRRRGTAPPVHGD